MTALPLPRAVRLTVRQYRFGYAMATVTAVIIALSAVFVGWLAFGPYRQCGAPVAPPNLTDEQLTELQRTCDTLMTPVFAGVNTVQLMGVILPIATAALLAAPLVAAELELGTATLAWSLARSRLAWLLPRMATMLLVVILLGTAAGLVLDWLAAQMWIHGSPWQSLYQYTDRGAIFTARVLLVAAAGLFAGALMGRQVPALVLGAVIAAAIVIGVASADDAINRANAIVLNPDSQPTTQDDLYIGDAIVDASTGAIVDWGQVGAEFPNGYDPSSPEFQAKYRQVALGIPASQAGEVVWRNVAFTLVPAALLLGLTVVVVERRRPYLS